MEEEEAVVVVVAAVRNRVPLSPLPPNWYRKQCPE
jgi:hypothetical protein